MTKFNGRGGAVKNNVLPRKETWKGADGSEGLEISIFSPLGGLVGAVDAVVPRRGNPALAGFVIWHSTRELLTCR
ncbi:MAG: hypothetical protein JWO51_4347 [Rhodospirillales bacterium]|nr:hypothetical protein [Rhodospirillales bacterium]